jgi:hypothetical protein
MATPPKRNLFTRATTLAKSAGSKVGMTSLGSPAIASAPAPADNVGQGANRTQIYTYLTKVGSTEVLYSGDRLWARVKVMLETGGPVVVGQQSKLLPITSGTGARLVTNQERDFVIAKGTKLYIASSSVNRVAVTIEPLPWLEQITALITKIVGGAASKLGL